MVNLSYLSLSCQLVFRSQFAEMTQNHCQWDLELIHPKAIDLKSYWTDKPTKDDVDKLERGIFGRGEWVIKIGEYLEKLREQVEKEELKAEELDKKRTDLSTLEAIFRCVQELYHAFIDNPPPNWQTSWLGDIIMKYDGACNVNDPKKMAEAWCLPLKYKKTEIDRIKWSSDMCDRLAAAFAEPYHDENEPKMKSFIENTLLKYAMVWSRHSYLSPYTDLTQSSGSGKSRTIKELGEGEDSKTAVFFICFQPKKVPGYPLRSFVADFLTECLQSLLYKNFRADVQSLGESLSIFAFYCAFLTSCLKMFIVKMEAGVWKQWLQEQYVESEDLMGKNFWLPIIEDTFSTLDEILKNANEKVSSQGRDAFESSVVRCAEEMVNSSATELRMAAQDTCLKLTLFAFDDFHELVETKVYRDNSYFHYLRYALATLPRGVFQPSAVETSDGEESDSDLHYVANTVKYEWDNERGMMNFFALMIDTQARNTVNDSSQSTVVDSSLRFMNRTDLYDPITIIGCWNSNYMMTLPPSIQATEIDSFLKKNATYAGPICGSH